MIKPEDKEKIKPEDKEVKPIIKTKDYTQPEDKETKSQDKKVIKP